MLILLEEEKTGVSERYTKYAPFREALFPSASFQLIVTPSPFFVTAMVRSCANAFVLSTTRKNKTAAMALLSAKFQKRAPLSSKAIFHNFRYPFCSDTRSKI